MKFPYKNIIIAFTLLIILSQTSMAQNSPASMCIDFVVIANETSPNCPGGTDGSAALISSGGAAPYTYEWSTNDFTNNIFNLPAGNYFATVTDANGCVEVIVITLPDGAYDSNPINGSPITDGVYHNVDVQSAGSVGASNDVTFRGSNSVCLDENFEVLLGGEFLGEIGPCQANTAPGPNDNSSDQ